MRQHAREKPRQSSVTRKQSAGSRLAQRESYARLALLAQVVEQQLGDVAALAGDVAFERPVLVQNRRVSPQPFFHESCSAYVR